MNVKSLSWAKALLAILVVLICVPAVAQADQAVAIAIAHVTRIQHEALVRRDGKSSLLQDKMALYIDDTVSTVGESRLEVTFIDGTTLTLGEEASITLDSFVYAPEQAGNRLAVSVVQGAFLFVSGQMGKQAERDMSVSTAFATIGIRGTTFWGGPLDNPLDVLLVDGKVEVQTPGGAVVLDQPGKGTTVKAPRQKPTPPTSWPEDKRARAFAMVAF